MHCENVEYEMESYVRDHRDTVYITDHFVTSYSSDDANFYLSAFNADNYISGDYGVNFTTQQFYFLVKGGTYLFKYIFLHTNLTNNKCYFDRFDNCVCKKDA